MLIDKIRINAMGNSKKSDGQKHLRARISYLYQAAVYMQNVVDERTSSVIDAGGEGLTSVAKLHNLPKGSCVHPETHLEKELLRDSVLTELPAPQSDGANRRDGLGQTHRFVNHLRAISLKTQIRLSPMLKHSTCKRCDSLLVSGSTSTEKIENYSRDGKKPWADVLVVTCNTCRTKKRFPVGAKRQPRRPTRKKTSKKDPQIGSV